MCDMCRKTPCDPRCPNADEVKPKTLARCDICNKEILYDEQGFYLDDNGEDLIVCDCCLENLEQQWAKEFWWKFG